MLATSSKFLAIVYHGSYMRISAAEKRGLWEGVVQEPLRRALFCVFLCSEVIFSCKSHRNFFQKLPLQCRHFLENPLAKDPKTQLLTLPPPANVKAAPTHAGDTRMKLKPQKQGMSILHVGCMKSMPLNYHPPS